MNSANPNPLLYLPDMQPEELNYIQSITRDLTPQQLEQFVYLYRTKRKDNQTILIVALAGFAGFAGIHRLILGQIGMGILYFLTLGFCGIGTIVDLLNSRSMTNEYNQRQAFESLRMVQMSFR
ncbi:NINE protein [Rudanella paleaurantiibacter]|uniref:NINE protein n=1 Tax=Rudanella paleaurantiibacter TaxID=2614655 RepID=A0A7J5U0H8_9BACT|nr:TM2 domain-containing protein [Rudanella paleaurantiibacter]KAB7731256.1 NINE protein [Rudanella paleaurantiibacter]